MVHSSRTRGIPPNARNLAVRDPGKPRAFTPIQSQHLEPPESPNGLGREVWAGKGLGTCPPDNHAGESKRDREQEIRHCAAAREGGGIRPAGEAVAVPHNNDGVSAWSSSEARAQTKSALANITSQYRQVHNRLPSRNPMPCHLRKEPEVPRQARETERRKPQMLDDEALVARHIRVFQGVASVDGPRKSYWEVPLFLCMQNIIPDDVRGR
jgi:hypothetical protein